tara:strand:+ start:563 stop:1903 length:1341 start_codon:yes stop_codon:yes gene_type:complete
MSKELLELSKLYSNIVEQGGASLPSDYKETEAAATELANSSKEKEKKKEGIKVKREGGGYTVIYPGSKDYKAAKDGTLTSVGSGETRGTVTKDKETGGLTSKPAIDSAKDEKELGITDRQASKDEKGANEWGKNDDGSNKPQPVASKQISAYQKGRPSPAGFTTNQRETRRMVKDQEKQVYPSITNKDLNQFSRSKTYTARDKDRTQVQRSTVFTKHYKTGKPLGVMGASQRKAYDLDYAKHLSGANNSSSKVAGNESGNYVKTTPKTHYTSKIGGFLNNKKKGDLKGKPEGRVTQWQDLESYDPKGESLSEKNAVNNNAVPAEKVKSNPKKTSPNVQINPEIKEGYGSKKKKKKTYNESIDAYDSVLTYLLATDQVDTIEEANYVMMEMDGKTIYDIRQLTEGMPSYVRDSIGRQYGTGAYKGQKYTIEDKKNVINWYAGKIPKV